jgi:hypothetical protein
MIKQSPESIMPEPFKTYVRQRSEAIGTVLCDIVGDANVQLCPRAIPPEERIFNDGYVYGTIVQDIKDGYKSVLYRPEFFGQGIVTSSLKNATDYAASQFSSGNRVRLKDPRESDCQGQHTVETISETEDVFKDVIRDNEIGCVLMPHLDTVLQRISVGQIDLLTLGKFTYAGREKMTLRDGQEVYGGTQLGLFRAGNGSLQQQVSEHFEIPNRLIELGLDALNRYENIALFCGAVSVDVVEGITDNGQKLYDVLDLTPRVGGTTPAVVLALREIYQDTSAIAYATSELYYDSDRAPLTGTNFIDTKSLVINAQIDEARS